MIDESDKEVKLPGSQCRELLEAAAARPSAPLRWGFVGTGSIAGWMASVIADANSAELLAASGRKTSTAGDSANGHDIENTFDSWADTIASDGVDAIYVAAPTSAKNEICIAAANSGKHVLGEKPFTDRPSLQRPEQPRRAH